LLPPSGFGGISARHGKKPIIAAVNGLAVGGGCEILLGCDLVFASPSAAFSLPDVTVGLTLLGGSLPALVKKIGRGKASDMCLTGRTIKAPEAKDWGLVERVVADPVAEAIGTARMIADNSPDALFVTREGILSTLEGTESGPEFMAKWWPKLEAGGNTDEGIKAFIEKRKPNWSPSKL
jgi:enoyl-CoA hydratase/carnithine racemase